MSSEYYNARWYDDRWNSVPPVMQKIAVDILKKAISEDDFELIRRKYAEYGHDWIHHLIDSTPEQIAEMNALMPEGTDLEEFGWPETQSAHHFFGRQIRNLLRNEELGAGITDDQLPDAPYEGGGEHRNWDDYYVQAIEAAAGLRE